MIKPLWYLNYKKIWVDLVVFEYFDLIKTNLWVEVVNEVKKLDEIKNETKINSENIEKVEQIKDEANYKQNDYLCCSIFNLFCCMCSIKARLQLAIGKTEEAKLSAKKARKFNIIGIFSGINGFNFIFTYFYLCLFNCQ